MRSEPTLVWVKDGTTEHPALLLDENNEETCVRWQSNDHVQWVQKERVTRNLLPRRKSSRKKETFLQPLPKRQKRQGKILQPLSKRQKRQSKILQPLPERQKKQDKTLHIKGIDPFPYQNASVAKYFENTLYYGKIIDCFRDKNSQRIQQRWLWHVKFNDGDSEDWDLLELQGGIQLYQLSQQEQGKLTDKCPADDSIHAGISRASKKYKSDCGRSAIRENTEATSSSEYSNSDSEDDYNQRDEIGRLSESNYNNIGSAEIRVNRKTYRIGTSFPSDSGNILLISLLKPQEQIAVCEKWIPAERTFLERDNAFFKGHFLLQLGGEKVSLENLKEERKEPYLKSEWIYDFDPAKRNSSFCYFQNRGRIPPNILGKSKPAVLELFSRVGGMCLGFKNVGMETRWIVGNAAAALGATILYTEDVTDFLHGVKSGDRAYPIMGEVDHIHAEPPGERFNCSDGEEAKVKNYFSSEFINAIRFLKPKTATYVNTPELLLKKNRVCLQSLISDLLAIDYQVRVDFLNSSSYGDPQDLSRVVLWAAKTSMKLPVVPEITHGEKLLPVKSVRDVIGCLEQYESSLQKKGSVYVNGIIDHNCCTKDSLPSPEGYVLDADSPQPQNCRGPLVHYNGKRKRTVREAALLKSFPWGFRFFGSRDEKFRQIENSLPIMMATQIARSVAKVHGLA